ncbi:MAG TPA: AI-2E family transporter [Solirubrobacteraceae bacterium]|jgi:predicted PurR-regulated permease PerM|nr:AI-2E family transporter [Solirubrobacteraceae bacterium]
MADNLEADEASQELLDEIHTDAEAEAGVSEETAFGGVGRPFDRRAPFFVGFTAALGVACALALAWAVVAAGQVLVLLGLAFFLAVGLDPVVVWMYRRGVPRWASVVVVVAVSLAVVVGFVLLAAPVVTSQASKLAEELPGYLHSLKHSHSEIAKLNAKYHFVEGLQKLLRGHGGFDAVGLGKALLSFISSVVLVVVVTIYLLADMPRVRRGIYLLAPRSRRPRMVLLTDEMMDRVGGYVLGNLLLSLIAGVGTALWALAFGIPYALLLGLLVALLDLIPIVGSTIGGIIVSLVALTVSVSVAVATLIFYVVYRLLEDYLLTPRVMLRTVAVPGIITVLATVLGAALLGIVGALVAIPVAAALKLLHDEIAAPRLENR